MYSNSFNKGINPLVFALAAFALNYLFFYETWPNMNFYAHKYLLMSGVLVFIEYAAYRLFFVGFIKRNDRIFPLGAWNAGSYANFENQTEGHRWIRSSLVKSVMKKGDLIVDKFRFDSSIKNTFSFYSLASLFENFNCRIDAKDLIKSAIIFGQMGSGKSEFYYHIMEQDVFNRSLIYDSKGDFIQMFYDPKRDIVLNPYDARSKMWNPFEEAGYSEQIIDVFFENLMTALQGSKKDFFSASAKDRYFEFFNTVNFSKETRDFDPKRKLQIFIDYLKEYFEAVSGSDRGSEKDVVSTMKLSFPFFKYLNFCINEKGVETFTITEFLKSKRTKLFMLDREEYRGALVPFFTAFLAAFSAILLSKDDDKEDLTGLILDEYLSFASNMTDRVVEALHTRIRSKGGCLLPGIQYLPSGSGEGSNEQLTQKLLNSATYWFIFQGIDDYTLERMSRTIGRVRYQKTDNNSGNEFLSKKQGTGQSQTVEENLVNSSIIQSLGEGYEHITFIPSKKLLYKGYTPQAKVKKSGKDFIRSKNFAEFHMQEAES
jgi:hypothetical protein